MLIPERERRTRRSPDAECLSYPIPGEEQSSYLRRPGRTSDCGGRWAVAVRARGVSHRRAAEPGIVGGDVSAGAHRRRGPTILRRRWRGRCWICVSAMPGPSPRAPGHAASVALMIELDEIVVAATGLAELAGLGSPDGDLEVQFAVGQWARFSWSVPSRTPTCGCSLPPAIGAWIGLDGT